MFRKCVRPFRGILIPALLVVATLSHAGGVADEPVQPIPPCVDLDRDKVWLGQRLFRDVRLSFNQSQSCATCHSLPGGGVDGKARSRRANGEDSRYNTPTVYNVHFNVAHYWQGRAESLEAVVAEEVPSQMGSSWEEVVKKLSTDPGYRQDFRRLFPEGIQAATLQAVLAEYLRSLITPHSRFDRFLLGEETALTQEERQGYLLFKQLGCASCHQGVNLGGNLFQKSGIFDSGGEVESMSQGPEEHFFKVPGLRNVAATAPYLHDGRIATLEEVVSAMGRMQLGQNLPQETVRDIVAFLKSLTRIPSGENE
ncbi:MAG: c-type cytochrome [Magnetococcales bacterium]|nr:c-type cytochrome [Magnetococcales bacterium]